MVGKKVSAIHSQSEMRFLDRKIEAQRGFVETPLNVDIGQRWKKILSIRFDVLVAKLRIFLLPAHRSKRHFSHSTKMTKMKERNKIERQHEGTDFIGKVQKCHVLARNQTRTRFFPAWLLWCVSFFFFILPLLLVLPMFSRLFASMPKTHEIYFHTYMYTVCTLQ